MCCAKPRLELLKNVVLFEVGLELCGNYLLQHLGEEREVGDGPVVAEGFRVQSGFFQKGSDDGSFKG